MNKLIEEHAIGKGIEMEIADCSGVAVDGVRCGHERVDR